MLLCCADGWAWWNHAVHKVKQAAHKVGHAIAHVAKKVAHGVVHVAKKIAHGVHHVWHKIFHRHKKPAPAPSFRPHDCGEIKHKFTKAVSSVQNIYVGRSKKQLRVYCDMTTNGGGWTVCTNAFLELAYRGHI